MYHWSPKYVSKTDENRIELHPSMLCTMGAEDRPVGGGHLDQAVSTSSSVAISCGPHHLPVPLFPRLHQSSRPSLVAGWPAQAANAVCSGTPCHRPSLLPRFDLQEDEQARYLEPGYSLSPPSAWPENLDGPDGLSDCSSMRMTEIV